MAGDVFVMTVAAATLVAKNTVNMESNIANVNKTLNARFMNFSP